MNDWSALFKCRDLRELNLEMNVGRAEQLPPPDLDFLAQLDKFSFGTSRRSVNQTWIDAWRKIVASRESNAAQTD